MQDVATRRFRPDENLIFHLIESQSSTRDTALRELVQNAYDAGATECHITLTKEGFSVKDDGRGFGSQEEIEQFFETFGTPHEEAYTERFGRFRMGRCQIMAFAPTCWLSNEFQMDVDFKTRGLDYDLQTGLPEVKGCHISGRWYIQQHEYMQEELEGALRECFEFFYRLPIYLNGTRISRSLEELKVTAENDDFYIIADSQRLELSVYNLGIYVGPLEVTHARWFLRGILLSKEHLRLDMSRKHWLWQQTEQWDRLDSFLRQHFPPILNRAKPSSQQIQAVLHALRSNEVTIDAIWRLKLFHDKTRTRFFTLQDLGWAPYTIVRPGDDEFLADKLNQRGKIRALWGGDIFSVFRGGTGEQSIQQFFEALDRQAKHRSEPMDDGGNRHGEAVAFETWANYAPFNEVATEYQDGYAFVSEEELTPQEVCGLKALRKASARVLTNVRRWESLDWVDAGQRHIEVGLAPSAAAWTDGRTYIAVHQGLLGRLREGMRGADYLAVVLIHEWCHRQDNPAEHNAEFYSNYHDLTTHYELALVTTLALEINANYGRYLRQAGLPVPVHVLRHMTGRAGLSDRQEKQFQQLLGHYADLHEQFTAVKQHFFRLLTHIVAPSEIPDAEVQRLVDSYEAISTDDWPEEGEPVTRSLRWDTEWTTLKEHRNNRFWWNVQLILKKFRGKFLPSA